MKKTIIALLVLVFVFSMASTNLLAFSSLYEELDYDEYISDGKFPKDFPFYQPEWGVLGRFDKFFWMFSEEEFRFRFVDEFGKEHDLIISTDKSKAIKVNEGAVPEADLRTNTKSYSSFYLGDFIYRYRDHGELSDIVWEDENYRYYLYPGQSELNEGLVGNLLSLETAEKTGERLISAFNGELRVQNILYTALPVGGGIAVVGSLVAVLLLRKKKKTE